MLSVTRPISTILLVLACSACQAEQAPPQSQPITPPPLERPESLPAAPPRESTLPIDPAETPSDPMAGRQSAASEAAAPADAPTPQESPPPALPPRRFKPQRPHIEGPLDKRTVIAKINHYSPDLFDCANNQSQDPLDFTLTWFINPDGTVGEVLLPPTPPTDENAIECTRALIATWRYQPPPPETAMVVYRFLFE